MDFSLTDEQRLIVESLRSFAEKELAPKYTHWDRDETFPREQWLKMGELGLFGLRWPIEYGGQNADCLTAGLVIEEIARGDFNCCYGLLNAGLIGDIISQFAAEPIRQAYLPGLAAGKKVMCVCLTEPQGGSDASAIRTRAIRKGDHYILSGEKSAITLLMVGDAAIVFAKTDPNAGARGVSCFLLPLDSPGVTRHAYSDLGSRGIVRGSMFLDDVAVPTSHLIGPENGGFSTVMQAFDYTRALIGLMCIGAAEVAIAETVRYLKERRSFGEPVSKNQGASFPLAEWSAKLEMARWLCYRTLWLRDQGKPHTREAAMCKMLVPPMAAKASHDCLILHGHYGYTRDFPIEQRVRDLIGQEIADGTPQIMKLIVARHLFGRDFV